MITPLQSMSNIEDIEHSNTCLNSKAPVTKTIYIAVILQRTPTVQGHNSLFRY